MDKNLLYASAVLSRFMDDRADNPGRVAHVLEALHQIDQQLICMAKEEDGSGIDHTEAIQELLAQAQNRLSLLGLDACLCFNDELPFGETSRLRIEIPLTAWDAASPLYL